MATLVAYKFSTEAFVITLAINFTFCILICVAEPQYYMDSLRDVEAPLGGSANFTCAVGNIGEMTVIIWRITRNDTLNFYDVDADQVDKQVNIPTEFSNNYHGQYRVLTVEQAGFKQFHLILTNVTMNDANFLFACGYLDSTIWQEFEQVKLDVIIMSTTLAVSTEVVTRFPISATKGHTEQAPSSTTTSNLDDKATISLVIVIAAAAGGFLLTAIISVVICCIFCRPKQLSSQEDRMELEPGDKITNGLSANDSRRDTQFSLNNASAATNDFPTYAVPHKVRKEQSGKEQNDTKPKRTGSQYEDVSSLQQTKHANNDVSDRSGAARIQRERETRRSKNAEGLNYADVEIGSKKDLASSASVKPPAESTTYAEVKINYK